MKLINSNLNFVGARKGASGTIDDLNNNPPLPKTWLNPVLVQTVMDRLKTNQSVHSRLNLHAIIVSNFFDAAKNRYRVIRFKNMITAAGVSRLQRKDGKSEIFLHFRDGEDEPHDNNRWMRQIL